MVFPIVLVVLLPLLWRMLRSRLVTS